MGLLLHIAWWFAPDGTERSVFTMSPNELATMDSTFGIRRSEALALESSKERSADNTD